MIESRVQALLHFFRGGAFEEKLDRFSQVLPGFLDGDSLARDVELGAQRDKAIAFTFDNRC